MTWQELADFINNKMPECNRNQQVNVWDCGTNNPIGGKFYYVKYIGPYDSYENPSKDNFYSIDINVEDVDSWLD